MQVLEKIRKTGPKKRGKRSVRNISSARFAKETPKNTKKSKNESDTKEEGFKEYACILLTHILDVRPEKCGFSA
jgi:hypothetical protein